MFGVYCPNEKSDSENRVLFLMREPGEKYDPHNINANRDWWNALKGGSDSNQVRYSNCFLNCLKYVDNGLSASSCKFRLTGMSVSLQTV